MWKANVLTLFPELFPGPLGASVSGKALEKGLWGLNVINIRDFARDAYKSVDDTPFGGGAGMVMRVDVLGEAIESLPSRAPRFYLSPRGKPLTQKQVQKLANMEEISLICGRFEGIDQRVIDYYNVEEVSIGDYILSGGELAAFVLIDAVVRLIPGVLGNASSPMQESFENGLLEYPHYTRPALWKGLEVPEVLTTGHHAQIDLWRKEQALALTRERRPDLLMPQRADS